MVYSRLVMRRLNACFAKTVGSTSQMSSLFEIIELPNGEIVLQRSDDTGDGQGEPLVSIKFSEESLYYLSEAKYDVAKAMIEAGLEVAGDIDEQRSPKEEPQERILH
jgi:hypothetical protein